MHILVLADRDWTHPQGGGTGTHLQEQVRFWLDWGHKVTVVAGGYPGALPIEHQGNLTVKRIGSRTTVFPRVIMKGQRALEPRADVVFEVINGITFLTPLWMQIPRVGMMTLTIMAGVALSDAIEKFAPAAGHVRDQVLGAGHNYRPTVRVPVGKPVRHGIEVARIDDLCRRQQLRSGTKMMRQHWRADRMAFAEDQSKRLRNPIRRIKVAK
jgi:hypothetical protein